MKQTRLSGYGRQASGWNTQSAAAIVLGCCWVALTVHGSEPSRLEVGVKPIENQARIELSWQPLPGTIYRIQTVTDLTNAPGAWLTLDQVRSANGTTGPLKWMAPESIKGRAFYRLTGPDPEIFAVEPVLINPADPDPSLWLTGQCFPTNARVEVNGILLSPVADDSGSEALRVSLASLPPGEVVQDKIRLRDSGSGSVIAEWKVQSPIVYAETMTPEQLQGPPGTPPASPSRREFKGHVTLLKAFDEESSLMARYRRSGHVTLLKAYDDEAGTSARALIAAYLSKRGYDYYQAQSKLKNRTGHVTLLKAFEDEEPSPSARTTSGSQKEFKGHITLLKREMTPGRGVDDDCDGVFAATGELMLRETDLAVPSRGLSFNWTRTYRSRTGPASPQGAGWDYSYNVSLETQADGTVLLRTGDGRVNTFYPDGTNGWFRAEYFLAIEDLDGDGAPDRVVFPNGGQWLFEAPDSRAAGKLSRIVDRYGNTMRLNYDNQGRAEAIVDTLGRTNVIAYDSSGLIQSVTDFSGRTVRYEYDGDGNLVACISPAVTGTPTGNDFPDGITNRYTYTKGFEDARLNHNLTACVDAQGRIWLEIAYHAEKDPRKPDFDAVDVVQRGTGREYLRRYVQTPSPQNDFAVLKAVVSDALGHVSEFYYDSRHRCLRQLEFTGRAKPGAPVTETENRPADKLRKEDPDYFQTQWTWSSDSLCTLEIRPNGDRTEIIHARALAQSAARQQTRLHDGDVRVVREHASSAVDTDADGAPDTAELAWYFEYDPRFGSPALPGSSPASRHAIKTKGTGADSHFTDYRSPGDNAPIIKGSALGATERKSGSIVYLDREGNEVLRAAGRGKGWDGTVKGIALYDDQDCDGFITRITDPRGSVTVAQYDAQGNCVRLTHQGRLLDANEAPLVDLAYNAFGQLTAVTNAPDTQGHRRVDTFTYHANGPQAGLLQSVVCDANGLALANHYEHDERGNIIRWVDARGHDWLDTYNALDQLVRVQSPTNISVRCATTHLRYDSNGNLVEVLAELRDADDEGLRPIITRLEYDDFDRCVAVARPFAPDHFVTNRMEFDGNGRLVAIYSPMAASGDDPHSFTQFEYDERGLLLRETGAPGSGNSPINEYIYDGNGNCIRVTLGPDQPREITLAYDGLNQVTSVVDPMGNETRYAYDRNGNLLRAQCWGEITDQPGRGGNRRLAETRFTCDSLNRWIKMSRAHFDPLTGNPIGDGEAVTSLAYSANGQCRAIVNDFGSALRFEYDSAGRLTSVTDPRTNVVHYVRDACDNIVAVHSVERSEVSPELKEYARSFSYDALNRCVSTGDNLGNVNRFAYDSRGRLVRHTDPRTNDTVMVYDDLNRLATTTSYAGGQERGITINTTHVEYNTNSKRMAATDSSGNTTRYAYDSQDRCTAITAPDGTVCHLIWSPRSNLERLTDANGTIIQNTFDLLDRCVSRQIIPGTNVAATTTFEAFTYDGLSRCVAGSNDVSLVTMAYDSLGHGVRSSQDGLVSTATYDGEGNQISLTYPSGRMVLYSYNELDELTAISTRAMGGLPAVTLASVAYDGPGRIGRITRLNGINTRFQWNGTLNVAAVEGDFGWRQVSGVSHQAAEANQVIDRRGFGYDHNQNKIWRAQAVPFHPGGALSINLFAYDALDRMVSFSRSSTTLGDISKAYVLDGNGNRQIVLANGAPHFYGMDSNTPPADFQMNQYTHTPLGMQTYDENGNVLSRLSADGPVFFHYDYADRLVQIEGLGGDGTVGPVASYAYDAFGRRIRKTTYPPAPQAPVAQTFVYGVIRGKEQCDDGYLEVHSVSAVATHIPGGAAAAGYAVTGRLAPPLVIFNAAGEPTYLHGDELGSVLALTDAAGNVLERYDYDDFGQPIFLTSDGVPSLLTSSARGNAFLFHGMEWDAETGLYHEAGAHPAPFDAQIGRYYRRAGKVKYKNLTLRTAATSFASDNPWTAGEIRNIGRHGFQRDYIPQPNRLGSANLRKEEGGRHTPFHNRRTYNLLQAFPTRWNDLVNDDPVSTVSLINPIAMDKGLRFNARLKDVIASGSSSVKNGHVGHVTLIK